MTCHEYALRWTLLSKRTIIKVRHDDRPVRTTIYQIRRKGIEFKIQLGLKVALSRGWIDAYVINDHASAFGRLFRLNIAWAIWRRHKITVKNNLRSLQTIQFQWTIIALQITIFVLCTTIINDGPSLMALHWQVLDHFLGQKDWSFKIVRSISVQNVRSSLFEIQDIWWVWEDLTLMQYS